MARLSTIVLTIAAVIFTSVWPAFGQTSAFTYQGKLTNAGAAASGMYDLTFKLFTAQSPAGSQVGSDVVKDDVQVTSGIFTVTLDFGSSPFTSSTGNFLEISVRPGASTGSYQQLLPRAPITSSPYAVQTLNAFQLNGLPASSYVQTNDTRLTDARTPTANSSNYIQNTTSQQPTSNFNISGNGIVGGSVGVGTSTPTFKLNVVDTSNTGLRVQTNAAGGTVASFGGFGDFQIDAPGVAGGRFTIKENGNTGIGTTNPLFKFQVSTSTDENVVVRPGTDFSSGLTGIALQSVNDTNSAYKPLDLEGSQITMNIGSGGNVGIGTTTPAYKLHVVGENIRVEGNATSILPRFSLNFTGGGTDQKRWQNYAGPNYLSFTAMNDAENAETGWLQVNRGTGTAISSVVFPSGYVGIGTSPSSKLHVVEPAAEQIAIRGDNTFSGTFGDYGTGVYGSSVKGYGGRFYGKNTGMFASAEAGSDANSAYGVFGFGSGTGSSSSTGPRYGVYGSATNSGPWAIGVSGDATGGTNAIGIYGTAIAGTNKYAGYFDGNVNVVGLVFKSGGGFKIDHPLDPANKYLLHSFVESPDMKNIYDGVITTDGAGEAVVTLPDWFEAINRDFRYQLTVIGQFAQATISEEIKGNQFSIRTDRSSVKVSWQVTGIRKDMFAEENRIKVEENKSPGDRGKCLYELLCGGAKIGPGENVRKLTPPGRTP